MGNKIVLLVGAVVSILYITLIVWFQAESDQKSSSKFLLKLDDSSAKIISILPKDKDSLEDSISKLCQRVSCQKSISKEDTESPKWLDLVSKLIFFINDNNISKASIIADKEVEINFLVKSKDELDALKEIYSGYSDIKDSSSVLEVFSIESIQKEIDELLKRSDISFNSESVNFSSRKVLNQIFRKIKPLGKSAVVLYLDIEYKYLDILKEFIKQHYPWVESIEIIKSDENKINIKEVVS